MSVCETILLDKKKHLRAPLLIDDVKRKSIEHLLVLPTLLHLCSIHFS